MNDIAIREACLQDMDAIYGIEQTSFSVAWSRESFVSAFESENIQIFAAEEENALIGFGCIMVIPPESEILNLAVLPQYRGQGIGGRLLSAMLACAEEQKAKSAYLEVRESNAPARALYEKNGFFPLGIRKNYYTKPTENAIIMQKKLNLETEL